MLGELMRKGLLTGLGLLWVTKEKAEQIVGEWVQEGQLNADHSKDAVDRLVKQAEKQRDDLKQMINTQVEKGLAMAGLAKGSDLEALRAKMSLLEERVQHLEQGASDNQ